MLPDAGCKSSSVNEPRRRPPLDWWRWWIRVHWRRAFDLLDIRPQGFASSPTEGHGVAGLRTNIAQLHRESARDIARLEGSASWRYTQPLRRAEAWALTTFRL